MKRQLLAVFAACLGSLLVMVTAGAQADARAPEQIVRSTTEQVLQALREDGAQEDRQRVYGIIEQMIVPHFDFEKMSRWVLGKNWKVGSPQEQSRFVEEFRRLLVRTYSSALMQYTDQEVVFLPSHADGEGGTATVKTQVNQSGGPPVPIDYRLYERDGAWKVFDVAVDGVSLVANYRTQFNDEISAKGLSGLIDTLAARNQQRASSSE
ncbi:MAG: MlaC/ttg2D family ABC transporter substrate-binding protein [Chromatiales bacterium]